MDDPEGRRRHVRAAGDREDVEARIGRLQLGDTAALGEERFDLRLEGGAHQVVGRRRALAARVEVLGAVGIEDPVGRPDEGVVLGMAIHEEVARQIDGRRRVGEELEAREAAGHGEQPAARPREGHAPALEVRDQPCRSLRAARRRVEDRELPARAALSTRDDDPLPAAPVVVPEGPRRRIAVVGGPGRPGEGEPQSDRASLANSSAHAHRLSPQASDRRSLRSPSCASHAPRPAGRRRNGASARNRFEIPLCRRAPVMRPARRVLLI